MPSDPVKPSAANSDPLIEAVQPARAVPPVQPVQSAKAYSAMTVAVNTGVVGVPCAALAIWAIETYWKPGGAPLPDWVASAIGTAIATAATYGYHVGSTLLQKWINTKLDAP